jgi:hypothetical protein
MIYSRDLTTGGERDQLHLDFSRQIHFASLFLKITRSRTSEAGRRPGSKVSRFLNGIRADRNARGAPNANC